MIAGDINRLADLIRETTIPRWLFDYITESRNSVIFDLKIFGEHRIPMPDGGELVIRTTNEKKK